MPMFTRDGADVFALCVRVTVEWPKPALQSVVAALADEQAPPPAENQHTGDPATSGLRSCHQAVYARPGTDICVQGHVWAPGGRPVTAVKASVSVGRHQAQVIVVGDRVWAQKIGGVAPSDPRPFDRMPIEYERSFGGPSEARNPVGCGLYRNAREANAKRMPNFEHYRNYLTSPSQRPTPVGLGPIPPNWQPRLSLSGTYDAQWQEQRMPYWPLDLDMRFFHSAHALLQMPQHLSGDEQLRLEGLHPDGLILFQLPALRLQLSNQFSDRKNRQLMVLDGLDLDSDKRTCSLYYRACVPVGKGASQHTASTLRLLEPWETAP